MKALFKFNQLVNLYDLIILTASLLLSAGLVFLFWGNAEEAERVVIKVGGHYQSEWRLPINKEIAVSGPLGITLVEIKNRQVRIKSDPGHHQYCVQQSWLSHAGESALCAPNQILVEMIGKKIKYDSLSY